MRDEEYVLILIVPPVWPIATDGLSRYNAFGYHKRMDWLPRLGKKDLVRLSVLDKTSEQLPSPQLEKRRTRTTKRDDTPD
jgi:hypothetical protein